MNLCLTKIKTYVGFAIKSREITYGVDDIVKLKNPKLVIVSKTLGESSQSKLAKFAEIKNVKVILLETEDFNSVVQNENIKAIAIQNKDLANAIIKNLAN